jgi:hypothetical protein
MESELAISGIHQTLIRQRPRCRKVEQPWGGNMNWISAALLTAFVVSFGIFAENHVRSGITDQQMERAFCTDTSADKNLFFVRYH